MDSIVIVGGIVLFVLLGPWVLVWRVSVSRKREREEDQGQWRELVSRISALEHTVQKLQAERPSPAAEEAAPKTSDRPAAAPYTPQSSSPSIVSPPPSPPVVEPTASVRVAENWVRRRDAESATTAASSTTDRVIPPAYTRVVPEPQASFAANGTSAVAGRPAQIVARRRRDAGHELAEQAGYRHPGAWCRVLSRLPTQDARSRWQGFGGIRDQWRDAGSGDLV